MHINTLCCFFPGSFFAFRMLDLGLAGHDKSSHTPWHIIIRCFPRKLKNNALSHNCPSILYQCWKAGGSLGQLCPIICASQKSTMRSQVNAGKNGKRHITTTKSCAPLLSLLFLLTGSPKRQNTHTHTMEPKGSPQGINESDFFYFQQLSSAFVRKKFAVWGWHCKRLGSFWGGAEWAGVHPNWNPDGANRFSVHGIGFVQLALAARLPTTKQGKPEQRRDIILADPKLHY